MKRNWEELTRELRGRVQGRLDLSRELSDGEVQALIDEEIMQKSREGYLMLEERLRLQKELFNSMRRLDMLQELIEDPEVTEIMVNGPENIFVERGGRLTRWEKSFSSKGKLEDVVQQIVSFCNRSVSKASPIADARLADGSRVNIVLDPVALNGPVITIRRFPKEPVRMRQLLEWGSISEEAAAFLRKVVKAGYNIFVSGGTGSGKTTVLNALSEFIPADERIITIEDNAELQLDRVENLVTLEARNANLEGEREITIRDLIKTSLRMRPEGIKIKKGKLKRKKKRIPIPHTFLQHILGNLIPFIRGEVVKIIEEADDLLSLFHSILHVEGILPINGICTQHPFSE